MRARIAAHSLHAQHDSRELTAPARKAFMDSFERKVDPDGGRAQEYYDNSVDYAGATPVNVTAGATINAALALP